MATNVLLMLSSDQPPPPLEEMTFHVRHCRDAGVTHVVTTRDVSELVRNESVVAYYASSDLQNRYLGKGIFLRYLPLHTEETQAILAASAIYARRQIPDRACALIELRDVIAALPGEPLNSLRGRIVSGGESNGLPLLLANLPASPARAEVWYEVVEEGDA